MIVKEIFVYRIVPYYSDVKEGDFAHPSKWEIKGERKQKIEECLEANRPSSYPKRDKCLYVCFSKENAYEWARIKYCKKDTPYKLLTLEITGELFWFMSDYYNLLDEYSTQQEFDNAAINYWNSLIEDERFLPLDKGYEGLFVGKNKIIAIEYKNYINGESRDIE
jgi:hypothetical protein